MFKTTKIIFTMLIIGAFLFPQSSLQAYQLKTTYPKRANYFLSWELSEQQARELSKWDMVILDMEHQVRNPDKLRLMRALNPSIIILAYITSQEIRDDVLAQKVYTPLRYELAQSLAPEWNLKHADGSQISFWPGTHVLNLTTSAPVVSGAQWFDALGGFIGQRILGSGMWDGVFLDNTWNSLSGQVGNSLDINNDGIAESKDVVERAYVDGFNGLLQSINNHTQGVYLIVGNDGDRFVQFNGMMFENFPYARGWGQTMKQYTDFTDKALRPSFAIINASTQNAGDGNQFQTMRFGLTSTLLGDGYYSFDFGDQDHGQTWWYDEYEAMLGDPVSAPYSIKTGSTNFMTKGVWRRDYTHGLVLVNTGDQTENIDLNSDFEKIKGLQDAFINNGQIVNTVSIAPHDGLILLRPLDALNGVPYVNGAFIRVYHSDGTQARNGFFSYNDAFLGGQTVAYIDIDNDGTLETIIIDHNKVIIKQGDTTRANLYPFGASWRGELSVNTVDTGDQSGLYLVFGQKTRGGKVTVVRSNGTVVTPPFEAVSKGFNNGVMVSAGHLNSSQQTEIVVGVANGSSLIKVFSLKGKLLSAGWNAFGKKDKQGVSVAVGDVNGDGKDEIIAGHARGKPNVSIFNSRGILQSTFVAGSSASKSGIEVASFRITSDWRSDIITSSRSCFFCGQ